jgi:hypothetical protein
MAFLDGELSDADAYEVSKHVEHCAECARLAAQLGNASQSLSVWKVPVVPTKLEESVTNLVAKAASGHKTLRADIFISTSFWTWKQWAAVGGGAMAALYLVLTISSPGLHAFLPRRKSDQGHADAEVARYAPNSYPQTGQVTGGSAGKFQADDALVMQSKSTRGAIHGAIGYKPNSETGLDQLVTQNTPGIAADSSGVFHGLGDHAAGSFSIDGQPMSDQQSNGSPASMIARTLSLSIVVKDFALCRSSLDKILERHHGYPEQLDVSTPENAPRTLQASLRIPAPQLSSAVSDLKALGRVENESQSGEEVTKQHTDLVARLKNSRDTEQRLRAILEQRTGNVAEVLQVEEEIARVRADIEQMEAERKSLEHRVDFATVELRVTEEYKAQLNPPAASVSTRMHNAFVAGYHNASETVFGIVLFFAEYGPTFLIWIAVPVAFLWRRYRRALAVANRNLPV